MATLDRSASGRRVCFRNLFKRSKSPITSTRKVSSDSNTSAPTSSSMSKRHSYDRHHHRKSSRHYQNGDSDLDSLFNNSPQHSSSLFRCFGSRTSKHSNSRKHRGSKTTSSMRRSKTCDDCIDSADSNMTTRSTAIDNNDGDQTMAVRRLRSRVTSFYSVVSFCDDDEGELPRAGSINRSKMRRSISRSGRDSQSTDVCDDDDDEFNDFFSLDGDFDYDGMETVNEISQKEVRFSDQTIAAPDKSAAVLCACGFDFHSSVYNPEFPIITGPGIVPDSHEEGIAIANACSGCWETIVERSETLDPQYRCIGLGMVKRAVMNRLAIPLTMFLEENDTIFHCWIHTPLGVRHMCSNLCHLEAVDDDPDAGKWTGITHIIDFSIPWYCNGKSVRAIQQIRQNPKVGTSIETRCILPDQAEGKIMLFQFVMIPKGKTEKDKLKADRILKYTGPKED